MNIKRINGLGLSLLLLTACSSHKVEPQNQNEINNSVEKKIESHVENTITPPIHTASPYQLQPLVSPLIIETPYEGGDGEESSPVQTQQSPLNTSRLDEFYANRKKNQYDHYNDADTNIDMQPSNGLTDTGSGELSGDFQGNYKLQTFINTMVAQYGFDENSLTELFSQAKNTKYFPEVISERKRNNSTVSSGKWDRYKSMFIYDRNIERGIAFWAEHEQTLNRAYQVYGVLPEYIVGIIGIETAYGVNFGKKRVIDVLTTRSMSGDRRAEFYTKQLEKFLIMTRKANLNPTELMGSNAGAMGYGQFIPSSYLSFAVDFNNDGVIDLWNAEDAIGSIANYFAQNGWKRSVKDVAIRAKYSGSRFHQLKTGYKTKYSQYTLRKKYKIKPRKKLSFNGQVSLIKLPRASYDELWLGTHNFRVITTYNHSDLYGMAVHQLAKAVKSRRYGG